MDQRRADALIDLLIGRADPPQVHIAVTIPADTLLGETAEPADVTGVGPITSGEALALAGITTDPALPGDRVFRRLLTDLDHTIPRPAGHTTAANLAVHCHHHHRLKHSPGWHAPLQPNGDMKWTTPTGQTVTTHPWAYTEPLQPFDLA